jgi:limonene-1,2-epoxide hydrolase
MATKPTLSSTATPVEVTRTLCEALGNKDVDAVMKIDADDAVGDIVAIGEFPGQAGHPAVLG